MEILDALAAGLVPPRCAACGRSCRPRAVICARCDCRLASAQPLFGRGPPGVDRVWSSALHQGVARDLVTALKFRRLLPVAELMAVRIAWLAPGALFDNAIVPVPPAPWRMRKRGFDPAGEVAAALGDRVQAPLWPCLARSGGKRQVGRQRAERIGNPPQIRAQDEVPASVLLVDDVLTTGATLAACAHALRAAGAGRVDALTFARRL